jgi:hypothetical protein
VGDGKELVEARGRGVGFTAPLEQRAKFSDGVTRHHRPFYDDYDVAKLHILQSVGDLSEFEVFGRNLIMAVFCRPNMMPIKNDAGEVISHFYLPVKEAKEDQFQHKAMLVLKMGPGCFQDKEDYLRSMFGDREPPKPGDWLWANASTGTQFNIAGEGWSSPQGVDHRGQPINLFEWDGWPCRILTDESFFGRLTKPHQVV